MKSIVIGLSAGILLSGAAWSAETPAAKSAPATTRPAPAVYSGDFKDTPARDVIMEIAKSAKLSAIVPGSLTTRVSAHFERMPVKDALAYVTALADADYRIMDRTLTVTSRKVVVGASRAETVVTAPRPAPTDVMREARRIDEEDLYRRPAVTRQEPVRVETYINVQQTGGGPSASWSMPYATPYLPRAAAYPYAYSRPSFPYNYGFRGYGWDATAANTVYLPGGAAITALPAPVVTVAPRSWCW